MFKHTHDSSELHSYVQRSQVIQRLTLIFFHPSIMLDHFLAKVLPLYSHYFLKWNIIVLLTFPYFISGDPKEGARLCWCYGRKCRGSVFYQRFKENKQWKSTGIHEEEAAVSGGEPLLKPVMVCSLCRSAGIISHSPLGLKEQTEVLSHTDTQKADQPAGVHALKETAQGSTSIH